MPLNTIKRTARHLIDILAFHGVRRAVLSPGSRNTPLIMAFERHPQISTVVAVDERTAAFAALGMSMADGGAPVALCCTSGTAPLNYAPALAEAYYRGLPLIAVTADRPEEWIDQDDSQTIRQAGIFDNFVKTTVDLPVESDDPNRIWMTDRLVNEAVIAALSPRRGPVQINVRLDAPLADEAEVEPEDIRHITRSHTVADASAPEGLRAVFAPDSKILIVAGFMQPGYDDRALKQLARHPNVVIMREAQSNLLHISPSIGNIDATLAATSKTERTDYAPDVVITLGGSLLSRYVKTWLRGLPHLKHICVSDFHRVVDPFRRLAGTVDSLSQLVDMIDQNGDSTADFKRFWLEKSAVAGRRAVGYADESPWSDFKAMELIMRSLPAGVNLQVSNGTAIRYVQLFDYDGCRSVQCNRGVSGIDGCTSTAIGAAYVSPEPTVLITGDMSCAYDIGALALNFIKPDFSIIVLNNGGGGIFRFIPSTASLPELERCFVADVRLPLRQLAAGYGFRYLEADTPESLAGALSQMMHRDGRPVILNVRTPGDVSAEVLRNFFKH